MFKEGGRGDREPSPEERREELFAELQDFMEEFGKEFDTPSKRSDLSGIDIVRFARGMKLFEEVKRLIVADVEKNVPTNG